MRCESSWNRMIRSYKTGPILSVSHGIGMPSLKIIINEVCKALRYAGSLSKCHFFRSGTCGGIGVEPGKLVLTRLAVDQDMNPFYVQKTMREEQHYPSSCVEEMLQEILDVAKTHHMDCVTGTTMTANGFYEDQARCDGFFCTFDSAQQKEFLTACQEPRHYELRHGSAALSSLHQPGRYSRTSHLYRDCEPHDCGGGSRP